VITPAHRSLPPYWPELAIPDYRTNKFIWRRCRERAGQGAPVRANPLGLQSLMLNLEGPEASYAYVLGPALPSATTERFEGPIGLDGLYRTGSTRPEGVIPVAKGHWSDDRTFVLQFEDLGGDNQRIAELSFNDDTIEVTSTTDEGRSAKARGEAAH
jgi:hypothetical protein